MQSEHPPALAAAQALIDEKWFGLETADLVVIQAALKAARPEEIAQRPQLYPAFVLSKCIDPDRDNDPQLRRVLAKFGEMVPQTMHLLHSSTDISSIVGAATALIIGFRVRGDLERAHKIGLVAQQRIDAVSSQAKNGASASDTLRPGLLEMQRGLTATMLGDFHGAISLYRKTVAQAGPPPYRHFAGVNAASNAAMLAAIEGHHDLALRWLREAQELGDVTGWVQHLTFLGGHIAQAQLAIEASDEAEAMRQLDLIGASTESVELWPFIAFVEAGAALAFGEPHLGYAHLRATGFAHGRDLTVDTSVNHLTFRAFLDLLIGMGEGGMALRLAKEADSPLRAHLPIARTYLLSGQAMDAARYAGSAIHHGGLPISDVREATGVLAVAQLQLGEIDSAKASFKIFATGQTRFHTAMNRRLPAEEFLELQKLTGINLETAPRPAAQPPAAINLARLTPKEHAVLQLLADGLTTTAIAERTATSPHTVRTHVKNLYRKLEVSSKGEAITKAELAGLLGWNVALNEKGD